MDDTGPTREEIVCECEARFSLPEYYERHMTVRRYPKQATEHEFLLINNLTYVVKEARGDWDW